MSENKKFTKKRSELLVPAGSLEKLKLAITYGADAVYLGTPDLSLRTKSNFTLEEVIEGVAFAQSHGKRAYLTLNLFSHNKDLEKLPKMVETIAQVKPDGVIVADPGVFHYVRTHAPDVDLHISTQANVCSSLSVNFWKDQGASLCVLGREVSFAELKQIREECPDIMLESFVHGSMCMTYSGRCLLSNFMAERGANQGNCAHSCRWNYKLHAKAKGDENNQVVITDQNRDDYDFYLEEQCRPGEYMKIEEDSRGSYIMNSKDLCLMPKLDEILETGIDSLKIEGRNKSLYYLAIVTRAYRMAIDDWYDDPESWKPNRYMEELQTIPNRGYTLAFHEGRLTNHAHNFENEKSLSRFEFAGIVTDVTEQGLIVHVRNKIESGDVIEFVPPLSPYTFFLRIYSFPDPVKDIEREFVNGGMGLSFVVPFTSFDREEREVLQTSLIKNTVVRKDRHLTEGARQRIELDIVSQRVELGTSDASDYQKKLDALVAGTADAKLPSRYKAARLGKQGCCGRGCNGCLIFTHDPAYARARELMKKKKIGELLEEPVYR